MKSVAEARPSVNERHLHPEWIQPLSSGPRWRMARTTQEDRRATGGTAPGLMCRTLRRRSVPRAAAKSEMQRRPWMPRVLSVKFSSFLFYSSMRRSRGPKTAEWAKGDTPRNVKDNDSFV